MPSEPWLYQVLVDPEAVADGAAILDLPERTDPVTAAVAAQTVFDACPADQVLVLRVGGTEVGVTSRRRLTRLGRAETRLVGDGDGATLPGESTRYTLLRFGCAECDSKAYRVHLDMAEPPSCPNGHGPMRALS